MAKNTPRVQICTPGANLHAGANCAHEHGFRLIHTGISIVSQDKFSDIHVHVGAILFYTLNINLAFLWWIRSYIDIIFKVFIASYDIINIEINNYFTCSLL